MKGKERVLIVGAGPVGMVCALALNRAGIAVTVLEQEPAPVRDQRAASLHPTTLEMLDRLDVLADIQPRGLVSPVYHFRDRVSGELVAEFDLALLADEFRFPYVLQYEQYKLTRDITARFANESDSMSATRMPWNRCTSAATRLKSKYKARTGCSAIAAPT